jgi:hypothetical protein
MTPERWRQVTEVFQAALARIESARTPYLDQVCAGDPALRAEVEAMLAVPAESVKPDAISLNVSPATTSQLEPGTTIGPYRIECLIGTGGMGDVYRAVDTKLNRPVAIKFLSGDVADSSARRRFQREAQLASSLNHPHILTVLDAGEFEGRQYLVTELVDGGTLNDWALGGKRTWRQSSSCSSALLTVWPPPMPQASSTAMSSRRTFWSPGTATPSFRTSDWPSSRSRRLRSDDPSRHGESHASRPDHRLHWLHVPGAGIRRAHWTRAAIFFHSGSCCMSCWPADGHLTATPNWSACRRSFTGQRHLGESCPMFLSRCE